MSYVNEAWNALTMTPDGNNLQLLGVPVCLAAEEPMENSRCKCHHAKVQDRWHIRGVCITAVKGFGIHAE